MSDDLEEIITKYAGATLALDTRGIEHNDSDSATVLGESAKERDEQSLVGLASTPDSQR